MSGMDQFLADYYGTGSTPAVQANDDETKLAQAAEIELFGKLAAANGIDLNTLTDAQIEQLYADTFSKEAEFPPAKEDKDDKGGEEEAESKKEKAKEEHEEKKASQEKLAEADFLGRVMAHAYVQELNKIAAATGEEGETKEALSATEIGMKARHHGGKALEAGKKALKGVGDAFSGKQLREGLQGKANSESALGKHLSGKAALHAPKGMRDSTQKAIHEGAEANAKKNIRHGAAKTVAAYGGAAAAAGGAAHAAGKKKESSAIDELAADLAVEKAAAAGWDAEESAERMNALLLLGASDEGSKVASVATVEEAIDIRASELLELAGYPVTWA